MIDDSIVTNVILGLLSLSFLYLGFSIIVQAIKKR